MSDFTAACAADVFTTASGAKADAAEAIGRALGVTVQLEVEQPITPVPDLDKSTELNGPALVLTIGIGAQGAVLVLPASGDWIPEWVRQPDATGKSKLNSLAQELGTILIPEKFMAETFQTGWVADGLAAVRQSQLATESARLNLVLSVDSKTCRAAMIWPAGNLASALQPAETATATGGAPAASSDTAAYDSSANPGAKETKAPDVTAAKNTKESAKPTTATRSETTPQTLDEGLRNLPPYTQSLLRIRVPVVVSLAETKQSVSNILKIGPGSILQFKKACDEALTLEIGRTKLAHGEAVKVGEKFGLWVTSMILPEERFGPAQTMQSKRQSGDVPTK